MNAVSKRQRVMKNIQASNTTKAKQPNWLTKHSKRKSISCQVRNFKSSVVSKNLQVKGMKTKATLLQFQGYA